MSLTQNPEDWARLGARIRAERERRGWSRREVAEMGGISPGSVQSAERGAVPKGRWPQSLSAIENVFVWHPGSMRAILEGGEPEYQNIVGAEGYDNSSVPAHGGPPEDWAAPVEELASRELPPEIQDALGAVTFFGSNCVAHGAPEWLGAAYDNAVAALLKSLLEPYPHRELPGRGPVATLEEVTKRNPILSLGSGSYGYTGALLRAAGVRPPMERMVEQMQLFRETQRKAAEAAFRPTLKRIGEDVAKQNKQLATSLARMSEATRGAALRDLERQLQAVRAQPQGDLHDIADDETYPTDSDPDEPHGGDVEQRATTGQRDSSRPRHTRSANKAGKPYAGSAEDRKKAEEAAARAARKLR